MLWCLADLLCESLSHLFNMRLSTCIFPTAWKRATEIPLYKGEGPATSLNNYRPISLLHPISRVFEQRLASSLNRYPNQNSLFTRSQFAYMPRKSATDQLLILKHRMAQIIDEGEKFRGAFLDFKKAFDRVYHPTSLLRLSRVINVPRATPGSRAVSALIP